MTTDPKSASPVVALKAAREFIEHCIEHGYMPDAEAPNSTLNTLPLIEGALAAMGRDDTDVAALVKSADDAMEGITSDPWEVEFDTLPHGKFAARVHFTDVDADDDGNARDYGHDICEMPDQGPNDEANARFIAWCRVGVPKMAAALAALSKNKGEEETAPTTYEAPRDPRTHLVVRGVGRVADEPRAILVLLNERPTDDEMREFHDHLYGYILDVDASPPLPGDGWTTIKLICDTLWEHDNEREPNTDHVYCGRCQEEGGVFGRPRAEVSWSDVPHDKDCIYAAAIRSLTRPSGDPILGEVKDCLRQIASSRVVEGGNIYDAAGGIIDAVETEEVPRLSAHKMWVLARALLAKLDQTEGK